MMLRGTGLSNTDGTCFLFTRRVWPLLVLILLTGCSKGSGKPGNTTTGQSQVERPKLTNLHQVGPKVDLLKLIDPQRDAIRGDFK